MFRGVNKINLDAKGRMALPARYRDQIADCCENQLVVTIDTETRCLLLYPLPEWETIEKKIESLPSFNPAARRIQRLLIGHATDLELDASGRFYYHNLFVNTRRWIRSSCFWARVANLRSGAKTSGWMLAINIWLRPMSRLLCQMTFKLFRSRGWLNE